MKVLIAVLVLGLFFIGCDKKEKICCLPPNIDIMGKWVDVNKREDTLVAYNEGNRTILFDNSGYYRSVQALIYTTELRYQFELKGDKIGVKSYTATASDPYIYYDFTWIQQGSKFKMLQNAIRPYISSLPVATYERIN